MKKEAFLVDIPGFTLNRRFRKLKSFELRLVNLYEDEISNAPIITEIAFRRYISIKGHYFEFRGLEV